MFEKKSENSKSKIPKNATASKNILETMLK